MNAIQRICRNMKNSFYTTLSDLGLYKNELYIQISKNAAIGFSEIYAGDEYINNTIKNMNRLSDTIPEKNMLEFSYKDREKLLMDCDYHRKKVEKSKGWINLFGAVLSSDPWQNDWDVNIVRDDLEKNGYKVRILENATIVKEKLPYAKSA